ERVGHREPAVAGQGDDGGLVVAHGDGFADDVDALRIGEVDDARAAQQVDPGAARAVHVGQFGGVDLDLEVVDLQAAAGRHQVLDGLDLAAFARHGAAAELAGDGVGGDGQPGAVGQVGADEGDARVGRGGLEADLPVRAREEPDAF